MKRRDFLKLPFGLAALFGIGSAARTQSVEFQGLDLASRAEIGNARFIFHDDVIIGAQKIVVSRANVVVLGRG